MTKPKEPQGLIIRIEPKAASSRALTFRKQEATRQLVALHGKMFDSLSPTKQREEYLDAVRSALLRGTTKELEGFLRRMQLRDERGEFNKGESHGATESATG